MRKCNCWFFFAILLAACSRSSTIIEPAGDGAVNSPGEVNTWAIDPKVMEYERGITLVAFGDHKIVDADGNIIGFDLTGAELSNSSFNALQSGFRDQLTVLTLDASRLSASLLSLEKLPHLKTLTIHSLPETFAYEGTVYKTSELMDALRKKGVAINLVDK